MDLSRPLTLLGGLSAAQFMKRHWQRKPLLVRGAVPGMQALVPRERLFQRMHEHGGEGPAHFSYDGRRIVWMRKFPDSGRIHREGEILFLLGAIDRLAEWESAPPEICTGEA